MTEYKIEIWGSEFKISADFSQASDNIKVLSDDNTWILTQYQVADFCHDAETAMEQIAYESLCVGDHENEKENKRDIKGAIEDMETEIDLEDYDEKIQALVEAGLVDKDEIDDIEQNTYDDTLFEIGDREYLVVTDGEADDLWEQSLDNYIDECILPELPEIAKNYFDEEKWKSDAKHDGRGHSLAGYDGEELEAKIGDTTYYIYRQN